MRDYEKRLEKLEGGAAFLGAEGMTIKRVIVRAKDGRPVPNDEPTIAEGDDGVALRREPGESYENFDRRVDEAFKAPPGQVRCVSMWAENGAS